MKLVFITNYVNHHQIPLADEFYRLLGNDYKYISTEPLPEWLINGGYDPLTKRDYIVRTYDESVGKDYVQALINNADVVISGAAPEEFVHHRIMQGKLTFRYSERWFRPKPWYLTGIRGWINYYRYHFRFRNYPLYMLAASAYTANDTYRIGCYKNKVYKWGYFTKVEEINQESVLSDSERRKNSILWCARFLALKHPELPIKLVKKLKDEGYVFHLDMIGSGEKYDETVALAKNLGVDDVVSFLGNMPNDEVLTQMRKHRIFLFTSDFNEGWGAVLNEAMSNGCAVVASDKIGAAPFLIKDNENGFMFKSEDINSLYSQVKRLLDNPDLADQFAKNAIISTRESWNPKTAAQRFVQLAEGIMSGADVSFTSGPCSKALPYK